MQVRQKDSLSNRLLPKCPSQPGLGWGEGSGQDDLNPDIPHGWQNPRYLCLRSCHSPSTRAGSWSKDPVPSGCPRCGVLPDLLTTTLSIQLCHLDLKKKSQLLGTLGKPIADVGGDVGTWQFLYFLLVGMSIVITIWEVVW